MRKITLILLAGPFIFLIWSCKENEDESPPVISFDMPAPNSAYSLPDTIEVTAHLHDDRDLVSVALSLADANGTPIVPPEYDYPVSSEYVFHASVPLTDKSIASGTYWLTLTASDGINTAREYQSVVLNEVALSLDGYLAVTASFPFESKLIRLDPSLLPDTSVIFPKGCLLSGFSGRWEQFFFASQEPSVLYAMDPVTFEVIYDLPAWLPRPEYSALLYDDDLLLATSNGDAVILNSTGQIIVKTQPLPGREIRSFAADGRYLYAETVSLSGNVRELTVFYRITGAIRIQRLVQDDVVALEALNGKALMISNSSGETIFLEFDPESMKITELKSIPLEQVNSTLKTDEDHVLIFIRDKVLLYDLGENVLTDFIEGDYRFGRTDKISGWLWLARDSSVEVYYPPLSFEIKINFEEPLRDFHLIYNKK